MILTPEQVAERAEKALRDLDALDGNDHVESCASTRDACLDCGWEFDEHPVKLEHGRVCEELRAHECTCGLTDAISALRASHELQRAEIEQLNSRIQEIAASHQSNTESLLEVARERDAVTAELARVAKENDELRADRERLDWLAGEMDREKEAIALGKPIPRSLFRSNCPITRAAIDAARERSPVANPTQTP